MNNYARAAALGDRFIEQARDASGGVLSASDMRALAEERRGIIRDEWLRLEREAAPATPTKRRVPKVQKPKDGETPA